MQLFAPKQEGDLPVDRGHGVILMAVWGPFGIMSTLYMRSISLRNSKKPVGGGA
jgi:hypothetical protein